MNILLRITSYTLKFKLYLILGYICTVGAVISYLLIPELLGGIVDKIDPNANNESFYKSYDIIILLIFLFILGITRGVFSYGQNYFGEALSFKVSKVLRDQLYDKTQKLDFYFHDKTHTGEMMSRVIVDIEGMRMFIPMGIVRSPYVFLMFVCSITLLLFKNFELALYACSFLVLSGFIAAKMRLKLRQSWLKIQQKNAQLNALLQENLNGIKVVKAFYAENHQINKFNDEREYIIEKLINNNEVLTALSISLIEDQIVYLGEQITIAENFDYDAYSGDVLTHFTRIIEGLEDREIYQDILTFDFWDLYYKIALILGHFH